MKKIMLLLTIIMIVIGIDGVGAISKGNKYGVKVVGDDMIVDSKYSFTPRFIRDSDGNAVTTFETNCAPGKNYYEDTADACVLSREAFGRYVKINEDYNSSGNLNKFYILYKNVGRYFDSNNNEVVVDMKVTLDYIDFGSFSSADSSVRFSFDNEKLGVRFQGYDLVSNDYKDRSANGTFKIQYYNHSTGVEIKIPSMISYTDIDIEILGISSTNSQSIYVKNIENNENQHLDVVRNQNAITNKVFGAYYKGCSIADDKYKITCRDGNTKMNYDEQDYASLIRNKQIDFNPYSITGDYIYFAGNRNLTADCTNSSGQSTHKNDVNCADYGGGGYVAATYSSDGTKTEITPIKYENASNELKNTLNKISDAGIVTVLYNSSPFKIKTYGWYTGFENPGFLRVESKEPVKKILEKQGNGTEKEVTINELEIDSNLIGKEVKYKIEQHVPNLSEEWYYKFWEISDAIPVQLDFDINDIEIKDSAGNDVKDKFTFSIKEDENKFYITAKDNYLTQREFYNEIYTIIISTKINKKICGNGSCEPSEIDIYKEVIKKKTLENRARLDYTYVKNEEKVREYSEKVITRFEPYDCESQLQSIKDSSKSNIEKISDIYYLYSNFPENNNLMNFNYESGSWNFDNTSCDVVPCGSNPSSMLSCESGTVESSTVGTNRNPRVCYADRYSNNIGSYYYEDLSAYCGYKIEYSLPFKSGVTVESGQLLWKTLSNTIGKVKISYVCEASYDYSDDSNTDQQIENEIKSNKRIDQNRILSSIIPTFNIEWESSTTGDETYRLIRSNYLFSDDLIEPTVECTNKKCYVRWNSDIEDIDLYYGTNWFVKSLNGILFTSGDSSNKIGNGLPIAVDEKTTNTSKNAILTVKIGSNDIEISCPYNVKNNILRNDGNLKEYNFDFRVIDTSNPFPGINGTLRNTGSNWCETSLIGSDSSDGSYIIGDLNGDGKIDSDDLNVNYFKSGSTQYDNKISDLNGDGVVTDYTVCNENKEASDYCLLKSYVDNDNNYCKGNNKDSDVQNSIVKRYIYDQPDSSSNNPMYSITLTPADISEIRKYNKDHAYNEFNMKCENQNEKCTSNFISDWMDGKIDNLNSNAFDLNAWCMNDRVLNKKWCDNTEVTE